MSTRVRGACPLDCPDTCAWWVTVEDGRATELAGDRGHPFTRGALCGKVTHYLDGLHAPDRLLHPLVRVGPKGEGRFARASWDEALGLVAGRLREVADRHGPEAILPYYSGGTLGKLQMFLMAERLFGSLGASYPVDTICSAATTAAIDATLGGGVGLDPEDVAHARLVLLWGTNTLVTNVHQWRFVLEARRAGAHVVAIDPIRTETARSCDEHLAVFPGTDAALALALMHVVVERGAHDVDWLERHASGWPALERRLREWPPERAAAICRLDESTIRRLGERLAATRPTAIRTLLGLQRHAGAAAAVRAICAIPAVTGDWRHVGGGVLAVTWGHSTVGAPYPDDLPRPPARRVNMSRLTEALTVLDDPPVRALVVMNANPAAAVPDQRRVRAALARDELFTVVLEHRLTDTADLADVVLPATMGPEHLDVATGYGHHYVAWNEPAVSPPGECLPNTEILRRLAAALGLDHPRLRDADAELARQVLAPAGIDEEDLRARGWARASTLERGTAPFADGGFPTPSGKVELSAAAFVEAGYPEAVDYVPAAEAADADLAARFPLVLVSAAGRYLTSSTFGSSEWHLARHGPPRVHLHPDDAAAQGLVDGDVVRVANDRGAFVAELAVDGIAPPGVAYTRKTPWPKRSGGANVNATTAARDTDLGGGPTFHDTRVALELVRAPARPAGAEPAGLAIVPDDPRRADVQDLLRQHLAYAGANTAPGHVHALDLTGLLDAAVAFYAVREAEALLAIGALRTLGSRHVELKSMHTARAHRGRGIGRVLVAHLLDEARRRGARRVSLETGAGPAFAPARALYAGAGFVECGPFGDYRPTAESVFMAVSVVPA